MARLVAGTGAPGAETRGRCLAGATHGRSELLVRRGRFEIPERIGEDRPETVAYGIGDEMDSRARGARNADPSSGLARFLHRAGQLKFVPRTGWLHRGVPPAEAESVADHTWRMALLAWLAAADQPELDRTRVLQLALIHDLAEAVTGDLPPYDPDEIAGVDEATRQELLNRRQVRSEERAAAKRAAEAVAMADLLADLPQGLADELGALWAELQEGQTPEARFVKQADKLETYLQSREYGEGHPDRPMASFAAEVAEVIDAPALVALREAIRRQWPDG